MVHRPHRVWLMATSQLPLPHTSSWLLSSHSGQRSLSRAKFTPPLALLSTGILSRLSTHLSFTLKYLFRLHLLAVPFSGCLISPTLPSLFLIFETLVTNVILSVCLMIWFIVCFSHQNVNSIRAGNFSVLFTVMFPLSRQYLAQSMCHIFFFLERISQ